MTLIILINVIKLYVCNYRHTSSGISTYSTPCCAVAFGSIVQIFSFPFFSSPCVGVKLRVNGFPKTFKVTSFFLGCLSCFDCFWSSLIVSSMRFSLSSGKLLFSIWCTETTSYSGTKIEKEKVNSNTRNLY